MTYITLNEKIISELRTISDAVGYLKLLEKKCWYFYPKIMSFLNENMKIKRRIFKHYGYGRKESWWRGGGRLSSQSPPSSSARTVETRRTWRACSGGLASSQL